MSRNKNNNVIYLKKEDELSYEYILEYIKSGNYLLVNNLNKKFVNTLTPQQFVECCRYSTQILFIPKHLRNDEFYELLTQTPCPTISRIPKSFFTSENVTNIIHNNPQLYNYCPIEFITMEHVRYILSKEIYSIASGWIDIANELEVEEIIKILIKIPRFFYIYSFRLSQDEVEYIIGENNKLLKFITPEFQTTEIALKMVDYDPKLLEFIEEHTFELIELAISKDNSVEKFANYESATLNSNMDLIDDL